MAITTTAPPLLPSSVVSNTKNRKSNHLTESPNSANPMSQDYQQHHHHQGIFNFPNGFDRPQQDQEHHNHNHQIRRDKLRVPGFEPQTPLVPMDEDVSGGIPVYETPGNMLSEMFNFPPTELLQNQIPHRQSEWYGSRLGMGMGPPMDQDSVIDHHHRHLNNPHHHHQHQHNHISSINGESSSSAAAAAAAMQLFVMNPQQQQQQQARSPPSPSHQPHETSSSSTLHMLLPNPSSIPSGNSNSLMLQGFHNSSQISPGSVSQAGGGFGQFTWVPDSSTSTSNPGEIGGGLVEGQGLSLSLSSSLQQLGAAKAEELRMGDGGGGGSGAMLFFNQGGAGAGASNYSYKNFVGGNQQIHVGYGASLGVVNVLRNSKYVKAAQELLEEFCSVGRGQFKKNKLGRQNSISNLNPNSGGGGGSGSGGGSSTSKDIPSLSAADKIEHQRRKAKLLTMIDEASNSSHSLCVCVKSRADHFHLLFTILKSKKQN